MRILLFPNSYPPRLGGLEIAVKKIAEHLARRGCSVGVVTNSSGLFFSRQVEPPGITVYRMPLALPRVVTRAGLASLVQSLLKSVLSPVLMPATLLYLLSIIKAVKPEVVNLHYIGDNALFCLAARRLLKFRLVVNIHGWDIDSYANHSAPLRWVTRRTLRVADRVLSNSADLLTKAERICPAVKDKSEVVGNGVDVAKFDEASPFQHRQPYVLGVGRFVHKKGFDLLVRAFESVHKEWPGVGLLLAGDGEQRDECEKLTKALGLGDVVKFLGAVDQPKVRTLLKGCELFVLPSRQEPFGIVILEAMASRKPVVATRVGGVPEIIRHMGNGILVKPESPEELGDAIILLFQDEALRSRLAAEWFETVKTRFTWDKVVDGYLEAYKAVLRSDS